MLQARSDSMEVPGRFAKSPPLFDVKNGVPENSKVGSFLGREILPFIFREIQVVFFKFGQMITLDLY